MLFDGMMWAVFFTRLINAVLAFSDEQHGKPPGAL